ncbi:MAG: 2-oxo acid dehydrogenase subunit E2 [Chromatiales bacterium]|nr:2-oxo acid dehydrogenase subunit E2 [Chromatiales bacterium]
MSDAVADFLMPSLGADMESAKVVEWLVKPGSRVKPGDVVAVVETHKGAIDVEIFLDGVIEDLAPLNQQLPVGALLAHVRGTGGGGTQAPAKAAAAPVQPAPVPSPPPPTAPLSGARGRVSPAARRRAEEAGIAADSLHGTGPDGAVTLADVELALSAGPKPAPAEPARAGRSGFDPAQMRQAIAAAMGRSKREIPHYYLGTTVDFHAAQTWLDGYNASRPPPERLLPAVLLLKATARALVQVPQLNGFHGKDGFSPGPGIHIGWAISLRGGGLVAPALHDVDRQELPALMTSLRDLVQRARTGGLRSSELTDPTITVTSLGERGADSVLGVIYPPQVAIVGFGRIVERPWVVAGNVAPRPLVTLSLAADHRASDGHLGGRLLAAIDEALQDPANL